ncbi:MAG: quinolinate synthase NadA [Planctomycetota bacterium]
MLWQPPIPEKYVTMPEAEVAAAITHRKAELAGDVVILGHHYQRDDVIAHADFTGDSFKLSQLAAERVQQVGAKHVVFCGVHFMAETADVLTDDDVAVILPDMGAGCSMADMADYDQTVDAWEQLTELYRRHGQKARIIPVCYMNSSAAIKAFVGEHGGAVCTSSNCDKVFDWALAGGDEPLGDGEQVKILFIPDQHLGRNTAADAGFKPDRPLDANGQPPMDAQMCIWNPRSTDELGGAHEDELLRSTFILWQGHCSVHKLFRPEHVDDIRKQWPDVTVMAHPECSYEVCRKADLTGSTEGIIRAIENAEPGSRWAIATEVHLVQRLCNKAAERGVTARILSECQCLCTTMIRIDPPHLLWVLDQLAAGKVVNRITVHPEARRWSRVSLDRMLKITGAAPLGDPTDPAELQDAVID